MAHDGNSLIFNQVVPPGKLDQPLWDYHMPHEDPLTHFDKDLGAEYHKKLELSRLKE